MGLTRVHLPFAGFAGVGWFTNADEVIDVINAGALILAWPQEAIIDVDLTVFTLEAWLALASVGIEMRLADSTMLAWV